MSWIVTLVLLFPGFRYVPSQADVVVFDAISSPPPVEMIHALRWYNHMKSYQKSRWGKGIVLTMSPVPRGCLVWYRLAALVFQVWRSLWVSMVLQVWPTPPLPPNLPLKMMTMTTLTCLAQTKRLVYDGGNAVSGANNDTSSFQEDEEAARIKEERLAQYAAKKAKSKLEITVTLSPWWRSLFLWWANSQWWFILTIFRLTAWWTLVHLREFQLFYLMVSSQCVCGNWPMSSSEPAVIAKSSILLDVKPWDDETDMAKLEECVRSIQMEGLVWGQCKWQ